MLGDHSQFLEGSLLLSRLLWNLPYEWNIEILATFKICSSQFLIFGLEFFLEIVCVLGKALHSSNLEGIWRTVFYNILRLFILKGILAIFSSIKNPEWSFKLNFQFGTKKFLTKYMKSKFEKITTLW